MDQRIYKLCNDRNIFIPCNEEEQFVKDCNKKKVYPSGGILYSADNPESPLKGTDCRCFYLDKPITREEGAVIAETFGLLGEYEYELAKGSTVVEALAEWDLLG